MTDPAWMPPGGMPTPGQPGEQPTSQPWHGPQHEPYPPPGYPPTGYPPPGYPPTDYPPPGYPPPGQMSVWAPPQPRPIHGLATAVAMLVPAATLAWFVFGVALSLSADTDSPAAATESPVFGLVGVGALFAHVPLSVAAWVVFLVWLHRARHNLAAMPEVRPTWSPGWSVGAWFIPYANFILGPLVLTDIARNSVLPDGRGGVTALIWTWMPSWLLGGIGASVGLAVSPNTVGLTAADAISLVVSGALLATAALCLTLAVLRTSAAQHRRLLAP